MAIDFTKTTWEKTMLKVTDDKTNEEKEEVGFKITDQSNGEVVYFNLDKFIQNFFFMEVLMNETYKEINKKIVGFKNVDGKEPTAEQLLHRDEFIKGFKNKLLGEMAIPEYMALRDELLSTIEEHAPEWHQVLNDNYDTFYDRIKNFIAIQMERAEKLSEESPKEDNKTIE